MNRDCFVQSVKKAMTLFFFSQVINEHCKLPTPRLVPTLTNFIAVTLLLSVCLSVYRNNARIFLPLQWGYTRTAKVKFLFFAKGG